MFPRTSPRLSATMPSCHMVTASVGNGVGAAESRSLLDLVQGVREIPPRDAEPFGHPARRVTRIAPQPVCHAQLASESLIRGRTRGRSWSSSELRAPSTAPGQPALCDDGRRLAEGAGDQRQRLCHQVEIRQPLRLPREPAPSSPSIADFDETLSHRYQPTPSSVA
jgi:hypothetical protein